MGKIMYLTLILLISGCILYTLSAAGQDEYTFIKSWPDGVGFYCPAGITIDKNYMYIADSYNNRILKLSSNGDVLLTVGGGIANSGNGQFNHPEGVALDSFGNIYVSDTGNHRIQKFDSNGRFLLKWGTEGSGNGQFSLPHSITIDSSGNIYVTENNNNRVQKFDLNGNFLKKWGTFGSGNGQLNAPHDIVVDNSGNIYVAELGNCRIQKFDSNGNYLLKWGSKGISDGQFNAPEGIAVDNSGNVYVADSLNHRIQKFDLNGRFLAKWGTYGSNNGQFNWPHSIVLDNLGDVYVTDCLNYRVQKFDPYGRFLAKVGVSGVGDGQFKYPTGITLDNSGNVYVTDTYNHRVQKFDSNGSFMTKWGSEGSGIGQFNYPFDITISTSGYIYVVDYGNHRIQKFDPNNNFLMAWGTMGSGSGQFNNPIGIASDISGSIYVSDWSNHRIQKFDLNGNFLSKWGTYGSGNGQFKYPTDIVVDNSGYIYVADCENHRIQKFDSSGNFIAKWGTEGSGNGQFRMPQGIAIDSSGDVYVSDTGNCRLQKFDTKGNFITKWGVPGSGGMELNFPFGIAISNSGYVYITDIGNQCIKVYNLTTDSAPPLMIVSFPQNGEIDTDPLIINRDGIVITFNESIDKSKIKISTFSDSQVLDWQPSWSDNDKKLILKPKSGYELKYNTKYTLTLSQITDRSGNQAEDIVITFTTISGMGIITTIAGTGEAGFSGDGGKAIASKVNMPYGVFANPEGDVYIADTYNQRIRRIDGETGIITTIAGTGISGFSGDGWMATGSNLSFPFSPFIDSSGNIFFADFFNHRVRRIDGATGIISTVVGTGIGGFSGDGGKATEAKIAFPIGVFLNSKGDIFISDCGNHRIRRIDGLTGIISTVAGTGVSGFAGDSGKATEAKLNSPYGIFINSKGDIFIPDYDNHRIRRVDGTTGIITTIAGTGEKGFAGDGGRAVEAKLNGPAGIFVDSKGDIFIADSDNHRIRRIDGLTGIITTVAGTGEGGFSGDGVNATKAKLNDPFSVFIDSKGDMLFADVSNHRIRRVEGIAAPTLLDIGNFAPPDTTSPSLVYSSLRDGITDVDPEAINKDGITLIFNEAIDKTKIQVTLKAKNYTLEWQSEWTNGDTKLTIKPKAGNELWFGIRCILLLSRVSDKLGNQSAGIAITFTTRASSGDRLIAYYSFDEGTGNVLHDVNGHHGYLNGQKWTAGKIGNALDFQDNQIEIPFHQDFNFLKGTIEAWINPSSLRVSNWDYGGLIGGIVSKAKDHDDYSLWLVNGGKLMLGFNYPENWIRFNGNYGVSTGVWTHVAATWDGQVIKLFINGKLDAQHNKSHVPKLTNSPLYIGANPVGINERYLGKIDEVYIYNYPRSERDVLNDYLGRETNIPIRLSIISSSPGDGEKDIDPETVNKNGIVVKFSDAIDTSRIQITLESNTQTHEWQPAWSDNDTKLTLKPKAGYELKYRTQYTLTFSQLTDKSGNQSAGAFITFTTGAEAGIITTIAGSGPVNQGNGGYSGDGGKAISAKLNMPNNVFIDTKWDMYIADTYNHRIRKIDGSTGIINTIAGSGLQGISNDGVKAIEAKFNMPFGVFLDSKGDMFIADTYNHRICRVDVLTGVVTTVAGTGEPGFSGDGGKAIEAKLNMPFCVFINPKGDMYIADGYNHRIRKIDRQTGIINTVAGTGNTGEDMGGHSGDGEKATEARLNIPGCIFIDSKGDMFIADVWNHRIRKVDSTTGIITTIAGTGPIGNNKGGFSGDGGKATEARLSHPNGVFVDSNGNIFISDHSNHRIRRIDGLTGVINTIAGTGEWGFTGDGTKATQAKIHHPSSVFVDSKGDLYISDRDNHRIRRVEGIAAPTTLNIGSFLPGCVKGDVNGDGKIRSNDAILCLQFSVGLRIPTSSEECAADMNDDGKIRSNDAIIILRKATGLASPDKDVIVSTDKAISIKLGETHGVKGEEITVPLTVDNIVELAGGDICISYDRAVLRAVDVSSGSNVLLAGNMNKPGTVSVAFACSDRLSSKILASIEFEVLADDVSPLKIESAELYSYDALPIKSNSMAGLFSSWAITPKESALLQNFPNPFNPDTWIPYQLREGCEVTISIFGVTGELVREIKLGYKTAGRYISRDRAAYWDGKNSEGEEVSSGVYFYNIKAGDFTAIRKMIITR